MVDREFVETVNTAEEVGIIVSKVGVRFCVYTGGVTLVRRGGTKSKGGFHRRIGINNVLQRSAGLMVAGGNAS